MSSIKPCDYSGERRLPACIRRQLADEIVFGKLPNTAGKLPALPGEDCFGETPKVRAGLALHARRVCYPIRM